MVPIKPNFKLTIFEEDGEYVICRRFFGIWFPIIAKKLIEHSTDLYFLRYNGELYHTHVERISHAIIRNKICTALRLIKYA